MSYSQYSELEDHYRRLNATPPFALAYTVAYTFGAIIAGAAILQHFGYPPRYLAYRLARMASDILGLPPLPSDGSAYDSEGSEDTQRDGGMFGGLFGANSIISKSVRGVTGALARGIGNTPPGLGNASNACYQNSVMQGLASLPSLRDYLAKTTSEHAALDSDSVNGALLAMIKNLNDPENKGRHFWIRGKLKSMSVWEQQDAQEYYSKILDAMDEEIKKASSSKRRSSVSFAEATKSLVDVSGVDNVSASKPHEILPPTEPPAEQVRIAPNPLDGLLAQRVGCVSCGYSEGLTLIPSNCITVPLGKDNGYDIRQCLDEYTALEYIDDVECAKCTLLKMQRALTPLAESHPQVYAEKLKAVQEALNEEDFEDKTLIKTIKVAKKNWVKSRKSKQAVVARAPKALVLHINRSSFNENTGEPFKNLAGVEYPSILDLGNWCLGNTPSDSQFPDMSLEEWPRDPNKSMLTPVDPMTPSPFQYRLRAAVIHFGGHGYGHYVCYRPHPKPAKQSQEDATADERVEDVAEEAEGPGEQWWRFSDDTVSAVPEESAHQRNVFMLFYERMDGSLTIPREQMEEVTTIAPLAEDVPLPPMAVRENVYDDSSSIAINIPLPDDDDILDLIPSESIAVDIPLPDDAILDLTQEEPIIKPTPSHSWSTPHTSDAVSAVATRDTPEPTHEDTEVESSSHMSEAESDAPSTQLTSDNESESEGLTPPTPKMILIPPISPHLMRTAGNASARGQGKRQSLPLVSAT